MTVELFSSLAPFLMVLLWSMFILTENFMVNLLSLLGMSLLLPAIFMSSFKVFWPAGLLLILMSTGLMVIFAYLVSLHSWDVLHFEKEALLPISLSLLLLNLWSPEVLQLSLESSLLMMEVSLGLVLISTLLILVVNFVRLVYSKGGGFRKKY